MLDFPTNGTVTVNNGNRTIRFGAFEADLPSGEIRKSGSRIKLQDQPFKVLQILLEHPGDLVTREELQSRIWPEDSFGDFDHAVNVAVGKLRAALGDSAENPSFIETVPRRGYRFVATVGRRSGGYASAAAADQRRSAQQSGIGIQPHAPGISRSRDLRNPRRLRRFPRPPNSQMAAARFSAADR